MIEIRGKHLYILPIPSPSPLLCTGMLLLFDGSYREPSTPQPCKKQTTPPSVPIREIYPNQNYPKGLEMPYTVCVCLYHTFNYTVRAFYGMLCIVGYIVSYNIPYKAHNIPYKAHNIPYKAHNIPYKAHNIPYKVHNIPLQGTQHTLQGTQHTLQGIQHTLQGIQHTL